MKENKQLKQLGSNGSRKQLGQAFGAFALGAAIGSTVALLYAPASGNVTRKRIGMKFRTMKNQTARGIKQAGKFLAKKAGDLKEVAGEKLGQTREWLVERASNGNGRRLVRHRRLAHHS